MPRKRSARKKPPSDILALVLFHTQLTLREFSFLKTTKIFNFDDKTVILAEKIADRNIELTLNESGPLIEKA